MSTVWLYWEDINALWSSAQDVNVKKCTHFATHPVKWENIAQKVK
nr:MAG TPA: hypothetical protein [Caudoviricetes sp.]